MIDQQGRAMTEVGYMGDPMRVTASAPGADLSNPETYFIPGSGLAKLDKLTFDEAGEYNLKIELSYKGLANVSVSSVFTILFDVTEDRPYEIEISQDALTPFL